MNAQHAAAGPRLLIVVVCCALAQGLLSGCGQRQPTQPASPPAAQQSSVDDSVLPLCFREVSAAALQQFVYQSGHEAGLNSIAETIGGGVGCIDYDLDGHCDLYFPGGGTFDADARRVLGAASLLLRGGPAFSYTDTTQPAGAALGELYTHGITAADYNHDGFVDLLVYGYKGVRLLRNQGDGTFQDATSEHGLENAPWTTAAAWGDLNGDGFLDLYLGSYVRWDFDTHRPCRARNGELDICSPNAFAGSEDAIFLGDAQGNFSSNNQLVDVPLSGRALSALTARFQPDQPLGLYVTNDLSANFLFRRRPDGKLAEIGLTAGVAVDATGTANGSMGVALLDFHRDGRFDLIVTNFEHEQIAFYRNDGNFLFRHASRNVGLNRIDAPVVGFGVVAADFSGDGWEDVLLTSGHVQYQVHDGDIRQEPVLLQNLQGEQFARVRPDCEYFHRKSAGRGLALADLDNDGDPDVVITHLMEPPVILESLPDTSQSWLRIKLVGTRSSRTPIGTVVTLTTGAGKMARQLFGGGSYLSQSQQELFFRWPEDEPADVLVDWPSGQQQQLLRVDPRQSLQLVEP